MQDVKQKEAMNYLNDLKKQHRETPKLMDPKERRLLERHLEASEKAESTRSSIQQMQNQIEQATASIGSMKLQAASFEGKAAAYLEYLLDTKFMFEEEGSTEVTPDDAAEAA